MKNIVQAILVFSFSSLVLADPRPEFDSSFNYYIEEEHLHDSEDADFEFIGVSPFCAIFRGSASELPIEVTYSAGSSEHKVRISEAGTCVTFEGQNAGSYPIGENLVYKHGSESFGLVAKVLGPERTFSVITHSWFRKIKYNYFFPSNRKTLESFGDGAIFTRQGFYVDLPWVTGTSSQGSVIVKLHISK